MSEWPWWIWLGIAAIACLIISSLIGRFISAGQPDDSDDGQDRTG